MKKILAIIAGLALAGAAFAQVNPSQPMLTGHGTVDGRPGKIIVVHQTAGQAGETVRLDKFVVTGSLINPSQPMLTGHGNVSGRPGKIIVVHQTAGQAGETVRLDKFVVTGSLMNHPAPKAVRGK